MSGICIINLKKHDLKFTQLNKLAKSLVEVALKTDTAICFNNFDYCNKLIKSEGMKHFFLISDSFLYRNCDLLNTSFIDSITDKSRSWKQFKKHFQFFNEYLKTIFLYEVTEIEIIISNEFIDLIDNSLEVNKKDFMQKLFYSIYDSSNKYAYGFPSIKFLIKK